MKARMALLSLFLLMLAGIAFAALFNAESGTEYPDSCTLDIQRMHVTSWPSMELNAEDVLQIHFETGKGSMHLEITSTDGTMLYSGKLLDP